MVVAECQENESCSRSFEFSGEVGWQIRCTHEETVAVVQP